MQPVHLSGTILRLFITGIPRVFQAAYRTRGVIAIPRTLEAGWLFARLFRRHGGKEGLCGPAGRREPLRVAVAAGRARRLFPASVLLLGRHQERSSFADR